MADLEAFDDGRAERRSNGQLPAGTPQSYLARVERRASGTGQAFDTDEILSMLWSRKFWILASGILFFSLALAYSLTLTPLYRSTVTFELNPPVIPILGDGGMSSGTEMMVPQTDYQFLETQYGLMKSQALAERVAEELGMDRPAPGSGSAVASEELLEAAGARLAGGISVEPVEQSRLVRVSFVSADPKEAARIVNAYAKAYLQSGIDRRFEATAATRDFLKQRLDTTRTVLNDAERKLVEYAKRNNIIETSSSVDPSTGVSISGGSLSTASLSSLNAALAMAQEKRIAAEQRYRQAGSISEVTRSTAELRQEKAKLQTEYAEKSNYLQDGYPEMVRIKSRIDAIDRAIATEAGKAAGSLRAEYQAALAQENALGAKVRQLSGSVLNERERSIQYNMLQRELDTNKALYQALLDRYNKVGVASGAETPQANIVDPGRVPGGPFTPNLPKNLLMGLLFGLVLGAGVVVAYEILTDNITTPDDVRNKLRLPLLGVIPRKSRKEVLAEQIADPKSPVSEAYVSLLTTLQFTTNRGMPTSLLLTSVRPEEGKSTASFVIAKEMAQLGKKVLLLDADMRKPSFVLEEASELGLSVLLTSAPPVHDHVVPTRDPKLFLMPSGPVPPNPSQLLNSSRFRQIMNELSGDFDCVIVDGPPCLGMADAALLGAVCDGVLLVIESGKVRRRHAQEAILQMRASNCTLLGATLSKYKGTMKSYGYGYNNRYYGNEEKNGDAGEAHELAPILFARQP